MNSLATKRLNFWNNICEALSLVLGRNFFHWLNATSTLASISASTPIRVSTIPVSGYTYTCERKWKCWLLSCVRLFAAPWNVARQAPVSVGFSRQEYWSGLPFPSPEDLPDPGIEPESPALQADSLPSEPPSSKMVTYLNLDLSPDILKFLLISNHLYYEENDPVRITWGPGFKISQADKTF